jgi:hypothetical protein
MKIEIKDAIVELQAEAGKYHLLVNGATVPIPREVGIALVFGETKPPLLLPPGTPAERKVAKKMGCQTPAAKRKLSASLKRWHAKKRAETRKAERAAEAKKPGIHKAQVKKPTNHKLNGAASHFPN